jgi:hypothetical protein
LTSRRFVSHCAVSVRQWLERKADENDTRHEQGTCNEAGSCDCVRCWRSCVACSVRAHSIYVLDISRAPEQKRGCSFCCFRCLFGGCGAGSLRPPLRPRVRRLVSVSGLGVRRQRKVRALFVNHFARLWKQSIKDCARTDRATLAHAMSAQIRRAACAWAVQPRLLNGFVRGHIMALTGVGYTAYDAPFVFASLLQHDASARIVPFSHYLTMPHDLHVALISCVSRCIAFSQMCFPRKCLLLRFCSCH